MRAIKHLYQCPAATFRAPRLLSALIYVINRTQKTQERPNPGRGKGSQGLGWGESERLRPLDSHCAAPHSLCSQNIDSVNTVQCHSGCLAAQPCPPGTRGTGTGRGRQRLSFGDGHGPGMGLRSWEGKGRIQGEKALGSAWGRSSAARGGQPSCRGAAGGTVGRGLLK